jgi:CheY-like chemotaxis protein
MPVVSWELGQAPPDVDQSEARSCVGRRVLVIDDNVDAADTLAALVVTLGGDARAAYSGQDGLKVADEFRPDVVLLDIGMPVMDGYETCRRLRAASSGPLYVVAVTGFAQQHDRERALADGFDGHLTKPADPRVLKELFAERRFSGADPTQVRTS